MSKGSTSAASVVFLVLLTLVGAWIFLPGLFDGNSRSPLSSKTRRSPIADIAGPRTVVDQQTKISEDMFHRFHFSTEMPATITVTVSKTFGPQFDVLLTDEQGFAAWKQANESLFGGEYSLFFHEHGSEVRRSVNVAAGNYVLVVDNSDAGKAAPPMNMQDDVLTAHVRLTVQ